MEITFKASMGSPFQDKCEVRAAAFELFGNLCKFGNGPSAGPFLEQIYTNLTAILLHLNDREQLVIKVSGDMKELRILSNIYHRLRLTASLFTLIEELLWRCCGLLTHIDQLL